MKTITNLGSYSIINNGVRLFWHYHRRRINARRDLARDQTVFSNGSCQNLIKVIRLIPREQY